MLTHVNERAPMSRTGHAQEPRAGASRCAAALATRTQPCRRDPDRPPRYDGTRVTVNGLVAPLGSTSGTPPIASWAYPVAPITIVARPVSETDAVAPGAKVCARTVVPVDEVTLIQQSDVVAPTRSE